MRPCRQQLSDRHAALQATLARPGATNVEKADAFGGVAMLLHAAEYYEAAEPAYLNAQDLAPREPRWPYLLHYLHKSRGDPDKAIAALTRVLELSPERRAGADLARPPVSGPGTAREGRAALRARPAARPADGGRAAGPRPVGARAQGLRARRGRARGGADGRPIGRQHPLAAGDGVPRPRRHRHAPTRICGSGETPRCWCRIRSDWSSTCRCRAACRSSCAACARWKRGDFKAAEDFFRQGVKLTDGTTMLGRSLRHKLGTALFLQRRSAWGRRRSSRRR